MAITMKNGASGISMLGDDTLQFKGSSKLQIGDSGSELSQVRLYTATINPASVAANTVAEQTFTVTGLATTDVVMVNNPALTAGLGIAGVRVSAANTLAVRFVNATAAPIDEASGSWTIVAIRA